ncbi:hypothetical protein H9L12_06220 [Sphingomonas rhizophila]|uniref:Uncharacterized protein n=1 Tax=Sphingomonas rhizophila TaxID=2071607 RepID=A0A7G9SDZ5_9SPHN|nr:hypothetical protein [Sphingomonas rhizophila]QNN66070.1 hypothetical protein H9L12_06220 [Sphingomonas rhizophila]
MDAVAAWQELIGKAHRLSWSSRLPRIVMFLAQGPLLWLGLAALWIRFRSRSDVGGAATLPIALGPIVVLTVAAIVLPMPPFRHYMLPIVAPLILWLAKYGWRSVAPRLNRPLTPGTLGVLGVILVSGTARTIVDSVRSPPDLRLLAVERQAHALAKFGDPAEGLVAGLEPVRLIDSGLPFDPRFATGPFLFRAGNLVRCDDPTLCPATFDTLDHLADSRPAMIITGHERATPKALAGGLDGSLERWMRRSGYRRVATAGLTSVWKSSWRGSSRAAP